MEIELKSVENLDENAKSLNLGINVHSQSTVVHPSIELLLDNFEASIWNEKPNVDEILDKSQIFLIKIIESSLSVATIADLAEEIDRKMEMVSPNFIQHVLKHTNKFDENIFTKMIKFEAENFDKFIEISQKFLDDSEMVEKVVEISSSSENILHFLTQKLKDQKLEFFWHKIKNFIGNDGFKDLLMQRTSKKQSVLHIGVDSIDLILNLVIDAFENRDEMIFILLRLDKSHRTFIHSLIAANNHTAVDSVFKILTSKLSTSEIREFLTSKSEFNQNFLQFTIVHSTDVHIHRVLWNFLEKSLSTVEIRQLTENIDPHGQNIIRWLSIFSTVEILKFTVDKVEKIIDMSNLLTSLNIWNGNLLHTTARKNKSVKFHQNFFKLIEKYFKPMDVLTMLTHRDIYGNNPLQVAVEWNRKEIVDIFWRQLQKILKIQTEVDVQLLNLEWIEADIKNQDFADIKADYPGVEINLQFLMRKFDNLDMLTAELLKKDLFGHDYVHRLIINGNSDLVSLTFKIFDENFTKYQIRKLLMSKNGTNSNILQTMTSRSIQLHQIVWQMLRNSLDSLELLEMIENVDKNGYNLLLKLAIDNDVIDSTWTQLLTETSFRKSNRNNETVFHVCAWEDNQVGFEFFWKKCRKNRDFKELIGQTSLDGETVLDVAACFNKNLKFHKVLWTLMTETFKTRELMDFLNNFVKILVSCNRSDVIDWTLTKFRDIFKKNQFCQILKASGSFEDGNLLHFAAASVKDVEIHKILLKSYKHCCKVDRNFLKMNFRNETLLDVFREVTADGQAVIERYLKHATVDVIDCVFQELEAAHFEDLKELLAVSNKYDQNLIHFVQHNQSLSVHKSFWMILEKYFEKSEILAFLRQLDASGENPMHLAVKTGTKEVIRMFWSQVSHRMSRNEQIEYLKVKTLNGMSLMDVAGLNVDNSDVTELVGRICDCLNGT